ncbi:uncharacterized protein C2orf78 homolog [Peromyscus californicus insignis]|uniref:uncharacterized protein C2orf78 homolog n=1 Tax=Peromyscus californicus insignis TaxID=564181 RepID=UPI0022A66E5A|nr:uncharacterized protein C2orf78 homolog [Peromyscus californicus insignis]
MDNKCLEGKAQKSVPSRPMVARVQGQDRIKKTKENNFSNIQQLKPSRHRVKTQEKPTIPKTKKKRTPPELSNDTFKKPQTHLGKYMLASTQVLHPRGKKCIDKTCISSSRTLLNFSAIKDVWICKATSSLLDVPCDG